MGGAAIVRAEAPIVLLHGQPGASRDWRAVIEALGDDARALALDRPGGQPRVAVSARWQFPELEGPLAAIAGPATIVIGGEDRIVGPASARRLAGQIPGAELVEIERAGHLIPLRHPRRLAEVIRATAARAGVR